MENLHSMCYDHESFANLLQEKNRKIYSGFLIYIFYIEKICLSNGLTKLGRRDDFLFGNLSLTISNMNMLGLTFKYRREV